MDHQTLLITCLTPLDGVGSGTPNSASVPTSFPLSYNSHSHSWKMKFQRQK